MLPRPSRRQASYSKAKVSLALVLAGAGSVFLLSETALPDSSRFLSGLGPQFTTGRTRARIALVRPFGTGDGPVLLESVERWDTHWPCAAGSLAASHSVDLFLSFSRKLEKQLHPLDFAAVEALKEKFANVSGWNGCLSRLRIVELDIPADRDRYQQADEQTDRMWVNGPNEQFRLSMRKIMEITNANKDGRDMAEYEIAVIMEPDVTTTRAGWLDSLLEEFEEKEPFAILGSKYKGHSWDNFKDAIPLSLREHINGNAAYNLTHPLFRTILNELEIEKDTFFNAVPYDYRISQMITEGSTGTKSKFPFPKMKDEKGESLIQLSDKMDKFRQWWNKWGSDQPIKKSNMIANFAATNFLPKHLGDEPIVHGKVAFHPWDPSSHEITLVVSDWHEDLASSLLSHLDKSNHPFSGVVVMQSSSLKSTSTTSRYKKYLWDIIFGSFSTPSSPTNITTVPVSHVRRTTPDFMDLCDADVRTEWFMLTNAYHQVSPDVDLMFTGDTISRPVIPYIPADTSHCTDYDACRETARLARAVYPDLDKVILDTDMLFHTRSRDAFCGSWKEDNGEVGEELSLKEGGLDGYLVRSVPRGPTATSYVAHLYKAGMADNLYEYTNRLHYGSKDAFARTHADEEEKLRDLIVKERQLGTSLRRLGNYTETEADNTETGCNINVFAMAGEVSVECGAGNNEKVKKRCCKSQNLECSTDGSFKCVEVASYNRGTRKRALKLSEPGILVAD